MARFYFDHWSMRRNYDWFDVRSSTRPSHRLINGLFYRPSPSTKIRGKYPRRRIGVPFVSDIHMVRAVKRRMRTNQFVLFSFCDRHVKPSNPRNHHIRRGPHFFKVEKLRRAHRRAKR